VVLIQFSDVAAPHRVIQGWLNERHVNLIDTQRQQWLTKLTFT